MHFEIDSSFIGGGIYMPQPDVLKAIRNEIYENVEEYKRIVEDKAFKSYFPEMYGEKLKTAPKDFPKDFSEIDFLKNKHFAITHSIDNTFWDDKNLVENIVSIFKVQFEFNQFLNKAVSKL